VEAITQCLGMEDNAYNDSDLDAAQMPRTRGRNSYIDLMNEPMPIRHASNGPRFQHTRWQTKGPAGDIDENVSHATSQQCLSRMDGWMELYCFGALLN
jgi:hypothetical protein